MTRPPLRRAATAQSTARAIWGRARATAPATVASSALIRRAISSEDLQSRSWAASFDCSVRSRRRFNVDLRVGFKCRAFRYFLEEHARWSLAILTALCGAEINASTVATRASLSLQ